MREAISQRREEKESMKTHSEESSRTREIDHDPNRKKKKKKKQEKKDENDDAEVVVANRVDSQTREDYSPKKKKKDRKKNKNSETTIVDEDGTLNSSTVESLNLGSDRSVKGKMLGGRNETEGKGKKRKDAGGSDLETVSEITHDGKVKKRRKVKEKGGDSKGGRKDEKSRSADAAESAPEDVVTDLGSDENLSVAFGKKKKKRNRL